ncbi:MAG: AIPR family protein [Rivularia sp. (in: cyanobacteria)]
MPKAYNLKIENSFCLSSSSEHKCIVALASVKDFPIDFPLTPNVREPNRKSSVYKQILDSLYAAPEKFADKHSGITISAHSVKHLNDNELELEILDYSEGYVHHGILNGGHTVLAFKNALDYGYNLAEAFVKVIIHVGLNDESSKDIGLATNTSSPVDSRSRMNARGDYDFIKEYVAKLQKQSQVKYRIAYYQNQSSAPNDSHCSINHIYKIINCLDCIRYNPDNGKKRGKHPKSLGMSGDISEPEKQRMSKLLHLLPQALWIEARLHEIIHSYISHPQRKGSNPLASIDTRKNTLLADSRYSFGFSTPGDLAIPVIAAYRVFLDNRYQWVLPFEEFREDLIQHLWKKHFLDYLKKEKIAGNSIGARLSRSTELWEDLYTSAAMYQNKLYRQIVNKEKNGASSRKAPNLILN